MKQKVKKALSICGTASDCEDCPYNEGESCGCIGKLIKDISEVLEEGDKTLFYYKEENKLLRTMLTKAHDEAVKDFAHILIDKAKDGVVQVCDLPDLVIEWGEAPSVSDADSSLGEGVGEADENNVWQNQILQRFTKTE